MTESRARQLRSQMTDAERVLWSILRRKQLAGFRFRRQAPIGPYFADFFCPGARLIVEVDGAQHFEEENSWRDYRRSKWLEEKGFRVIRFTNDAVFRQSGDVALEIQRVLLECAAPHPPAIRVPSPRGGHLHPPRGEGEEEHALAPSVSASPRGYMPGMDLISLISIHAPGSCKCG